jgi:inhibitor of KinA sporulation pathway (predicted exonuclease)
MEDSSKPFYLVLDFEANCSSNGTRDHEIIEFPAVLINAHTGQTLDEFQQFVRTVYTGKISAFVEDLTGITNQQILDHGIAWFTALERFDAWCQQHGLSGENTTIVTCGDWDLKTMLPRQLMLTKTKLTPRLESLFGCWHNVKIEYRNVNKYRRQMGMANMLMNMKLELVGRHHSGIDDCRNIARICVELKKRKGSDVTRPNRMCRTNWWYLANEQMPYRRTKRGRIVRLKNK